MWDAAKTMIGENFIILNAYIRKERAEVNLTFHLRKLEKGEQFKPKPSRRKVKKNKVIKF